MLMCTCTNTRVHLHLYLFWYIYVLKTSNSNRVTMLMLGVSLFTSPMPRNLAPVNLSTAACAVSFPSCARHCIAATSPTRIPVQTPFSAYIRPGPPRQGLLTLLSFDTRSRVSLCGRHVHLSQGSGCERNRQTPTLLGST